MRRKAMGTAARKGAALPKMADERTAFQCCFIGVRSREIPTTNMKRIRPSWAIPFNKSNEDAGNIQFVQFPTRPIKLGPV